MNIENFPFSEFLEESKPSRNKEVVLLEKTFMFLYKEYTAESKTLDLFDGSLEAMESIIEIYQSTKELVGVYVDSWHVSIHDWQMTFNINGISLKTNIREIDKEIEVGTIVDYDTELDEY